MPELPEIKRYARMINQECKGLEFTSVQTTWAKHPAIQVPWSTFTITATARGKELMITLANSRATSAPITIVFTHGLVGSWEFTPKATVSKYAHVHFTNGTHTLSFLDMQKMGGWSIGSWGKDRGADPVDEHDQFCKDIMDNLHRAAFDKDICEVLLEQSFFNGIGNYLRAEILNRANVNPFMKAREVFKNTKLSDGFQNISETSNRGLILLYLCQAIPLEVLEKGLNKYGNAQEKAAFEAWLRVYNKGDSKKDKKGRTIHYTSAQLAGTETVLLYKSPAFTGNRGLGTPLTFNAPSGTASTSTAVSNTNASNTSFSFSSNAPSVSNTTVSNFGAANSFSFGTASTFSSIPAAKPKAVQPLFDAEKIDRICDLSRSTESASLVPGYSCFLENPEENQFHVLQLISVGNGVVFWQRFGPSSSLGVQLRQGPLAKEQATVQFEQLFKTKTGNDWVGRGSFLRQPGLFNLKSLASTTSAPAFTLQAAPSASSGEMSAVEHTDFAALDPMAKLLVLLANAWRKGLLSSEQKVQLKQKVLLDQAPILYNALEAYERDLNEIELADTFARVLAFDKGQSLHSQFVPASAPSSAPVQRSLISHLGGTSEPFQGLAKTTAPIPVSVPATGGMAATLTDPSWRALLEPEFSKPYFKKLEKFVDKAYSTKEVFPPKEMIFSALNLCPFDKIKVVILGQDPYHDNGQAHGLCFSVMRGVPVPPSLKNIYKELKSDVNFSPPEHGNLEYWAKQGVLLLNTVLTVEAHKANSHKQQGWETFTDEVIRLIGLKKKNVVFLLWGAPAQAKEKLLKVGNHHVLKTAHPSPLSAHNGFMGCKHFSRTNEFLQQQGAEPINWQLPME